MKKSIALLCFALAAGASFAAQAANDVDARCAQLSADIAARSVLFLKATGTAPESTAAASPAPAAGLQRLHDNEAAQRDIAGEIWSLRTRMAYLDCAQARTFAY